MLEFSKEILEKLASDIGPRGAGQEGEAEAASYLRQKFSQLGFQVEEQNFKSISTYSYLYLFYFLFIIFSAVISFFMPFLAVIVSLFISLLFIFELQTFSLIQRFFPQVKSQNIIAKQEADGLPARKIVFLAHYDSAKSSLSFKPGMVESFEISFFLTKIAVFAVAFFNLVNFFWSVLEGTRNFYILGLISIPAIYLLVPVFYLIHRELFLDFIPGANDNASGVAALMGIAKAISEEPKTNNEFWLVATGCEEAGNVGMLRFLNKYKDLLLDAYFINFDNLGEGKLKYIIEEGMLIGLKANPELIRSASRTVYEEGLNIRRKKYRMLTTDATPAIARKFKAMSVMAFNKKGILPNLHWPTDTIEKIDFKNIEDAVHFGQKIIKYL